MLCLVWSVLCLSRAVCAVCCLLFVSALIALSGVFCHLCCLFIFGVVSLVSLSVVIILHHHQYQHSAPFFFSNQGITLKERPSSAWSSLRRLHLCSRHVHNIPEQSAIWPAFFNCLCSFKSSPSICPSESQSHIQKVACRCTPGLAKCHHGQTSIEDQVHGDDLTSLTSMNPCHSLSEPRDKRLSRLEHWIAM